MPTPARDEATTDLEEIEVFADILCPFTHVGLHRLVDERARRGRTTPRLHVRAWPLELVNGAPLEGDAVAEKASALRASIAPGLFTGLDPARFPATSRPALALAAAAYRQAPELGESVGIALRDAVFELGQDIADPTVLARIAAAFGVGPVTAADEASVETDWADGVARGVIGSPHFFVGATGHFCPTLHITHPDGRLVIEFDEPAFTAFADDLFGREPAPT